MTGNLTFKCKKCEKAVSVSLSLKNNEINSSPQLQIEIECSCKSKKDRKTIYDITSYLHVIGRNFDVVEKA